jgi:serine/threonine protein kinase/tetratricopeptide (TPR) repeat protein
MFAPMPGEVEAECPSDNVIAAFVAGSLDARGVARLDRHLDVCEVCLQLATASAGAGRAGTAVRAEPNPSGALAGSASAERFERHALIAQGGMGAVYHGLDRETGQPVAIKCLRPGSTLSRPSLLARFMREAEVLRRVDHPNIVRLIASVTEGDTHQIVMEYVGGGSLRQLLQKPERLPVPRVVAIVLELADALARAHHLGVIHRDIKPENVLLTESGTPKIGDFGLAMILDHDLSSSSSMLGTIAYLSPEALGGQPVDGRADLWALGVMTFEMLAGQRPFDGPSPALLAAAVLQQEVPELRTLCPDAPLDLIDLVYGLLERNVDDRIGSARLVGARLEALGEAPVERAWLAETLPGVNASSARRASKSTLRLPAQTTPFVGREAELEELSSLLVESDVRLLSIVGPGGMGKSRLALELARRADQSGTTRTPSSRARFSNGVVFVDLAPLPTADLVASAVAQAVGMHHEPGADPRRQLLAYLRDKNMLLLIDNFEHVIAGAGFVHELLTAAPGVKVLATSRERLGLRAETQFALSGMPIPQDDAPEAGLRSGAAALFVDCARRVDPRFDPQGESARDVVEICRLVHGTPLALVLAASWIDSLSPAEIAAEIAANVDFLSSSASDLPTRHHGIRAIFDHSWALSSTEERAVFASVSLFRGGFTRQAAELVAGATPRTLASLLGKSLLRRAPGSGRYEAHELSRQYAEAKLRELPELHEATLDRFSAFYAAFVSERTSLVLGPGRHRAVAELQTELDNIRQALDWMLRHRHAERLRPAMHALGMFYHCRRSRPEAESVFGAVARAFAGSEPDGPRAAREVHALAVLYQALFSEEQGKKREALALVERAVSLHAALGKNENYALALTISAWIGVGVRDPEELAERLDEGVALCRGRGKGWWLVRVLTVSSRIYASLPGGLAKAEASLRECVALQRQLGHGTLAYPDSLAVLGLIRCSQGHRREGCALILDSLSMSEAAGDAWATSLALQFAARAHRDLGDYTAAEAFARRCIAHARDLGGFETVAWCHLTLASILRQQQRPLDAIAEYEAGAARSQGNRALLAKAELGLGGIALTRGDYAEAERHISKGLGLCDEQRSMGGRGGALEALGTLACEQGQPERALDCYRRAFDVARREDRPAALVSILVGVARCLLRSGRSERAAELTGLALRHPATPHPLRARDIDPLLEQLGAVLGPAELSAALLRGEGSSLEHSLESSFDSSASDGLWAGKTRPP